MVCMVEAEMNTCEHSEMEDRGHDAAPVDHNTENSPGHNMSAPHYRRSERSESVQVLDRLFN